MTGRRIRRSAGADSLEGPLAITRVPKSDEIMVLVGDPPVLRAVESRGRLGRARSFELAPPPKQFFPLQAARSSFGDWLISAGWQVRWLRGSKHEPLPLPPLVATWDVGFLDDRPVAAVEWLVREDSTLPLLLEWTGREWETLLDEDISAEAVGSEPSTHHVAAVLSGGSGGSLWLGFQYRHRVLRVDRSGKVDLELRVGDAGVQHGPADPEAEKRATEAAARIGGPPGRPKRVTVFVNTARPVIDALAEGPDGRLYVILNSGDAAGSRTLERFDPLSGVLDRTGVRLAQGFPVRMVAGKEGLVIAALAAKNGVWLLPWEAIDGAQWTPVDGAVVTPPPRAEPSNG